MAAAAVDGGKVTASGSARQDLIGTITRADGTVQVTYNDHPVYRFVKDKKAGDTKGQGVRAFGAKWYLLDARRAGRSAAYQEPAKVSQKSWSITRCWSLGGRL